MSWQGSTESGYIIHEGHAGPIEAVAEDSLTVQVNEWLTWQFEFRLDPKESNRFTEQIKLLTKIAAKDGHDLLAYKDQKHIPIAEVEELKYVNPHKELAHIPFDERYLIEGLISQGIIVSAEVPELLCVMDECCHFPDHRKRLLTALYTEVTIRNLPDTVSCMSIKLSLTAIRAKQLSGLPAPDSPHLALVYRCVVTPTRLALYPPQLEVSNEALRLFHAHGDRFIRATFTDENDCIQINPTVIEADVTCPSKGTLARVRRALNSGLSIAGRHYVFLASGNASARQHTCWFVAEDTSVGFTADAVRHKLGFGQIAESNVAGYAARMGIVSNRHGIADM